MSGKPCRFYIQSEYIRGEGTWWYVDCAAHSPAAYDCTDRYGGELAFLGRGAKQAAEKAHKIFTEWVGDSDEDDE